MVIGILTVAFMKLDIYLRFDAADIGFFRNFPICDRLISGVEGYENPGCLNTTMLRDSLTRQKEELETATTKQLMLYVPLVLPTISVETRPDVQFITETTSSRTPIVKMLDTLYEAKNDTDLKGEDIECSGYKFIRGGALKFSCSVYGSSVLGPMGQAPVSSRTKTFQFLDRLQKKDTGFSILNYPSTLPIDTFKSAEPGIKSLFETRTKISLDLLYTPPEPENRDSEI
ncbi:MAG TPA: hypothetical protein PK765_01775 [bacterium]|nr:hypothetical protein [bacterium]